MNIYESLGVGFVVFSTALTSIELIYFALVGIRSVMKPAATIERTVEP